MRPLLFAFVSLLVLVGCYETKYSLGPRDTATVNVAYVGDYTTGEGADRVTITIRNIDNKTYYAQWTEVAKEDKRDKPLRMIGFTADVKGVTFAHLRGLTDDGTIPDKHLVMRVSLSEDRTTLSLRNLSEDFFKSKTVDSDQAFRAIVEQSLDDASMYEGDEVKALRLPPEK
jgi:hypothetical protein